MASEWATLSCGVTDIHSTAVNIQNTPNEWEHFVDELIIASMHTRLHVDDNI